MIDVPEHSGDLRRGFGLATPTATVVASMIGVGVLTTSGYILKDTGSNLALYGLWLAGGLIAMCGALTVTELATSLPATGGEYVFIREAYGKLAAFLYGWISLVIGFAGPTAIIAYGAGLYLVAPFWPGEGPAKGWLVRGLAAGFVVLFTLLHLGGQRRSAFIQSSTTLLKMVILAAMVAAAALSGRGDPSRLVPASPDHAVPWSLVAISLVYVMYSYTGWNAATYLAGEVRDPVRVLPWATMLGCIVVTLIYLVLNLVYVYALPVADLRPMGDLQVEPIALLAMQRLIGPRIYGPLSVGLGVGLLASVSAYILTGPRVSYAMARDGLFPAMAARLGPAGTPTIATLTQGGLSLALLCVGNLKDILTYAGIGLAVSSFFVILAVFVLRIRRPDLPRPFRTPGYPLVPLIFLACTAWMIAFAFRQEPKWSAVSLGVIALGVPMFYVWQGVWRKETGDRSQETGA